MNPSKVEEGLFHHHLDPIGESPQPLLLDHHHDDQPPPPMDFCLPPLSEFDLFRDDDDEDSVSRTSSDAEAAPPTTINPEISSQNTNPNPQFVNPDPHISSQFYTFNLESHSLMIRCILDGRLATPDEIRAATPQAVLASWRSVWKDRNEDTAYLTAWKRIQDKLTVHRGQHGNEFLCFKNNSNNQFVSHTSQWQEIVMSFHGDADLKHLGLKETIEKIKQVWTVGAKFYGIPESFIRACVASCPICSDSNGSGLGRSKRRRFEYTESLEVPANEVPTKLQQLAAKHKVVLCIRQKYIRYKPFMAEVKDYACHRAGEPAKKSKILKREPYASKRCGCGFRIRAIVPISNYNEKEKTFVYQEEGTAVFKLYAVHSGHEPGPLDGNARIMHRVVGYKGGFLLDNDYDIENENEIDGDMQRLVLQQVKELKNEIGLLEGKVTKMRPEVLSSVSQELFDLVNKVKSIGEYGSKPDALLLENDLVDWSDHRTIDLIEDDDDSFERISSWDQISGDVRNEKEVDDDSKGVKWRFDEKTMLNCEDSKWYDTACGLDPGLDCGGNGFRHGEIV